MKNESAESRLMNSRRRGTGTTERNRIRRNRPEAGEKPEDTQVSGTPLNRRYHRSPMPVNNPQSAQPGALEQGFNTVKDLVGALGNIVGGFNEYFTIADSPEKIEAIRRTLQAWRNSPSLQNADEYLKNLRSSNGLRQARFGDALGKLGKGLDVLDALNKAVRFVTSAGIAEPMLSCGGSRIGQKSHNLGC